MYNAVRNLKEVPGGDLSVVVDMLGRHRSELGRSTGGCSPPQRMGLAGTPGSWLLSTLGLIVKKKPCFWLLQGIIASGITYYVQGLVMKTRGPVFVTAFNPLCMIIVAALGSIILAEKLYLGRPVLDQNLYYLGMKYTSATFASASINVLPAITFILAIIFRLERINVKKVHDVAKIVGTGITVAGAMVMTLYKGPIIDFIMSHGGSHHGSSTSEPTDQHWVIGTLMLLASCCGWASFFILQSFTLKQYPAELSLTALICLMGMVQGATVSLVMERDPTAWKIGFDSRLLAAAYSGVVCSGIAYYVQAIVIKQRGPVFATSFSPLCMIITAAMGTIILAEQLHLGSVIGAVLIVVGLYTVVWGKSKDRTISTTPALTDENKNGTLDFANADDAKSATNFDISIHNETSQIPAKSTPLPV
ncbi:hypothetical protein GH714_001013 [Hevea brasiliensis]|uniref:EamA domain-containing protein n=1 Tax=Hevea brasiliensis TaxID=3981 RepID=A0A6A6L6P9_HEVBR|nr:hypothetical protein GH714_001013 [Hevea brasiliensis]